MQVYEIFESFHGEANGHHQGRLVTFVRFSGCNLECPYCDTKHALSKDSGTEMTIDEILSIIYKLGNKYICFTGGEPLLQTSIIFLAEDLVSRGFKISVETNGSIDITFLRNWVESFVLDFKLDFPDKMNSRNYQILKPLDIIKFVIKDQKQFIDALKIKEFIEALYPIKCLFAFSPMYPFMKPESLSELILSTKIIENIKMDNLLFSLQIHKISGFQ